MLGYLLTFLLRGCTLGLNRDVFTYDAVLHHRVSFSAHMVTVEHNTVHFDGETFAIGGPLSASNVREQSMFVCTP